MCVEREENLTRFTCDYVGCRKNYEGVDGFGSAWKEAKAHGWVNAQNGDEWEHYCPDHKRLVGG